jgi:hypothetical protein
MRMVPLGPWLDHNGNVGGPENALSNRLAVVAGPERELERLAADLAGNVDLSLEGVDVDSLLEIADLWSPWRPESRPGRRRRGRRSPLISAPSDESVPSSLKGRPLISPATSSFRPVGWRRV